MFEQRKPIWEVDQYSVLINKILHKGEKRKVRNGETYAIFGETLSIDISEEFPLLRGRKMFYNPVLGEFAAFIRGPNTIDDFKYFGCNYWDAWAIPGGNRIKVDYGNAWIDFNGVNQLEKLVESLINDPNSRRHIVTGWRPDRLSELSLPCCHMLYQWFVRESKYLDMVWYQRSVDTMVGLPSDIILAAVWTIALANQCGYIPGKINLMLGDTHIYTNHMEQTLDYMRQLSKVDFEQPISYEIDIKATVTNFRPDMLTIKNYDPKPAIKFELNV